MAKTLEEFFKIPANPPANYVLDPSRDPDKERAEKVKAANAAEVKENLKSKGAIQVSGYKDDKVVKKKLVIPEDPSRPMGPEALPAYNRAPEPVQPVAPAAPQSAIPSVQKESGFPLDRLLVGATPLLVGLLTGNELEGTSTAANYYTKTEGDAYKNEQDLASKLALLRAKRDLAATTEGGKKRYQGQTIALKDGTNVKATFDTFTGKYLLPDGSEIPSNFIRAGYSVNPEEYDRRKQVASDYKRDDADYLGTGARPDPTTGELGIVRNGQITPVEGQRSGQLNVKNEKDVKEAVKEFTSSAPYKDSAQALQLAPQVNGLLDAASRKNDPNSIAGSSVVLMMIRQAQRTGVATDKDAAALGGTQQWYESLKRLEQKLLGSGEPLTERDINDLREVSNIYTKRAKQLLGQYYNEKKGSFATRYNLDPSIIDEHVGAEVRPYMIHEDSTVKANSAPMSVLHQGKTYTSPSRSHTNLVEINGKAIWASGSWEDIKKAYPNAKRIK